MSAELTKFVIEVIHKAKMMEVLIGMYDFANEKNMSDDITDDEMITITKELGERKKFIRGITKKGVA
jgi:hypothetical protein